MHFGFPAEFHGLLLQSPDCEEPLATTVTKVTTWAHSYKPPRLFDAGVLALQSCEVFHQDLTAG